MRETTMSSFVSNRTYGIRESGNLKDNVPLFDKFMEDDLDFKSFEQIKSSELILTSLLQIHNDHLLQLSTVQRVYCSMIREAFDKIET
mmetsp:Transcript_41990/g.40297  ORF Transcript_41990/g.40297 Transcript_41990/m.40297 type:complete len:88 (+) Transcript_41990:20-283(+)